MHIPNIVCLARIPLLCTFAFLISDPIAYSQFCNRTSVGLFPLGDLGAGSYRGLQGGLYPNGQNERPATHNLAGVELARLVRPLDTAGNPDSAAGKIVLLSIGMSNTRDEFQQFQIIADTFRSLNTYLELVNGAQGNEDIDAILDTANTRFWIRIADTLSRLGLSELQVQAIWFKQAEAYPGMDGGDTTFLPYITGLKEKFTTAMNIAREKFPNAGLAYVSSRIYGGYANIRLNPEPFAYYTGWADKLLIGDQINGDPDLDYSGPEPRAPWLSWGVDLWADGLNPRSDGLIWMCPDDFKTDGTHPSDPIGREKVANLLLNFFSTDETTTPWFLGGAAPSVSGIPDQTISVGGRFLPIRADDFVTDPDHPDSEISWSWSGNSILSVTWDPSRRRIRVRSPNGWAGSETLTFIATDPDGNSDSDEAAFAVVPAAGDLQTGNEDPMAPSVNFLGNYPNPFNPATTFTFEITEPIPVSLKVFDTTGREVAVVQDGLMAAGRHTIRADFAHLASGVYVYRFEAGKVLQSGKIVFVR